MHVVQGAGDAGLKPCGMHDVVAEREICEMHGCVAARHKLCEMHGPGCKLVWECDTELGG